MATGTTQEELQKAAQAATDQARAAMTSATESAKSSIDEQLKGMAEWAADGLERVSATLRRKDLDGMLRDVQFFAREQPVAFFAAAVAAGFLATRFLKAGSRDGDGAPTDY